ncbi:aspartyl-phosphate phosphatase Spo0E family protein [Clostridium ganghwense]|uniref:aspartyl-phosphate phosphatase Spo0E family protein n=1 Tax=Clostridium ganghwense TaxID=312089 RepID=UPI00227AB577|nr:aspartyl-phosphate phosphatase Spo0E family protein [Clostridium ganghwense]
MKLLDSKIEYVKKLLYTLLDYKKPTDIEVINCSQYLDKLIIKYQNSKFNSKKL